eukprot:scaffold919_cov153-Ochromonas_danica.AAC.14
MGKIRMKLFAQQQEHRVVALAQCPLEGSLIKDSTRNHLRSIVDEEKGNLRAVVDGCPVQEGAAAAVHVVHAEDARQDEAPHGLVVALLHSRYSVAELFGVVHGHTNDLICWRS